MLTPTVAAHNTQFYALGNTPAISLTRGVPQGVDADILLLGCGDVRNVLFTAFSDTGLPRRKLDITCCDISDSILARNIFLYTLILDGDGLPDGAAAWSIYYDLYIENRRIKQLQRHLGQVLASTDSLQSWHSSRYGKVIRFCDEDTFNDVKKIWLKYADAIASKDKATYKSKFASSLKASIEAGGDMTKGNVSNLTSYRSAAPLGIQSMEECGKVYQHYWKHGLTDRTVPATTYPNPLFAASISSNVLLHYGTDPVLGFHLAVAYAELTDLSPSKLVDSTLGDKFRAVAAAREQFRDWSQAFKRLSEGNITIRFVGADALAFCHTLQQSVAAGDICANMYRRLWDARPLTLLSDVYGSSGTGPKQFDAIDTSNLADHFGALNLLVAATPLLKDIQWATVHTEHLLKYDKTEKDAFDGALCGHAPTIATLLGISPVEYWTNATADAAVDETLMSLSSKAKTDELTQLRSRIAWKSLESFSGSPPNRKLSVAPHELATAIFQIYLTMFEFESGSAIQALAGAGKSAFTNAINRTAYPRFHRASLSVLIKTVKTHISTDWDSMCSELVDLVTSDRSLTIGNNSMQDFCLQLFMDGIYLLDWFFTNLEPPLSVTAGFASWKPIPPAVAITLVVPRNNFDRLFGGRKPVGSPALVCSTKSSSHCPTQFHNLFSDVHLTFGRISTEGSRKDDGYKVHIHESEDGWAGNDAVIASFYAPTVALFFPPDTVEVCLTVQSTIQNTMMFASRTTDMDVYKTTLADTAHVYVTKFLPGQKGLPARSSISRVAEQKQDVTYHANFSPGTAKIASLTGHVDLSNNAARKALEDKVPIRLEQSSPFSIDVVFGEGCIKYSLDYPVPIDKEKARTRIARQSAYVDVITPFASSATTNSTTTLGHLIYPTVLTQSSIPATINIHHLSLDTLPILDVSKTDELGWLVTFMSFTFSSAERSIRAEAQENEGTSKSTRVNFKDSMFIMFMLAAGLQGGQTGLFAIRLNHPTKGGNHMLIFVSAMRLDAAAGSVVLDAAVIPLTEEMLKEGELGDFLMLLRELNVCVLDVKEDELATWKRTLPALAERCRTWEHGPKCEYKKAGAKVPLSLELGQQALCSCGHGQIPAEFIGLPGWEEAAKKYATRIAISPTFAVPCVEETVDMNVLREGLAEQGRERCNNCGATEARGGGLLKKCVRCKTAKYCSVQCQKKDWKKHRNECAEN